MNKTLVIINKLSGSGCNIDGDKLKDKFCADVFYYDENSVLPQDDYATVIAAGGDGTLNHLINDYPLAEKIYIPCGTFNETAKCAVKCGLDEIRYVGRAADELFSYVCAAGTFTPLGYAVDTRVKRRLKVFAYLLKVIGCYKVTRISATVTADGRSKTAEYSLIMLSNSRRCFGFNFNKLYNPTDNVLQLLTVKSPKHDGLLGCIELFFPFFRAFFIGFSKPHEGDKILFVSARNVDIDLSAATAFCVDGDKKIYDGKITAASEKIEPPVKILLKKNI